MNSLLLYLLAFSFPLAFIPFSNLAYLFLLLARLSYSVLRPKANLIAFILFISYILIYSIFRSSLDPLDSLLGAFRYILAAMPLFFLDEVVGLWRVAQKKKYYNFLLIAVFFTPFLSFSSSCTTAYGSFCIYNQPSSSFGSAFAAFGLFTLISLFDNFSLKNNAFMKISLFSLASMYFLLGLSQGARSFYLFMGFFVAVNFLKYTKIIFLRLKLSKFFAFSLLLLSVFIIIILSNFDRFAMRFKSLERLYNAIFDLSNVARISEGYVFSIKESYTPDSFMAELFGNGIFSQLSTWSQSSAYDSSINFLLSDFGVFGLVFIPFIVLLANRKFIFGTINEKTSEITSLSFIFYCLASLFNEFIVLKAFNANFIVFLSLLVAYNCQNLSFSGQKL